MNLNCTHAVQLTQKNIFTHGFARDFANFDGIRGQDPTCVCVVYVCMRGIHTHTLSLSVYERDRSLSRSLVHIE
jgi:hypothetical protein